MCNLVSTVMKNTTSDGVHEAKGSVLKTMALNSGPPYSKYLKGILI